MTRAVPTNGETAATRAAQEDFHSLVEGANQGIYVHRQWRPLFANQAFASMLGFASPAELLAAGSLEPNISAHDLPRLRAMAQAAAEGRPSPAVYVYEALSQDGRTLFIENVMRPIRWQGGPALQVTAVDVTARRQAEQRNRLRQDDLAHAERLSTLGALASGLAHELNQPLCAVSAYAAAALQLTAREAPGAQELPRLLREMDLQARRAGEIVRHLRALVRKGESRWISVDLTQVLSQAAELARGQARDRQVQLLLETSPGVSFPLVRGDPVQLEQVLLNLILNALEALEQVSEAPRRVRIGARRLPPGRVRVWVSDNGPGLPPGLLASAFTPIESGKPGGLGLGLSISRTIVEAHGGELGVEPAAGTGTTFTFTLPTVVASEP